MITEKRFRHELKFFVSYEQYTQLRCRLGLVMKPDLSAGTGNRYLIRSLYFDDVYNSAYYDKINGVERRKKYRIRLYNHQQDVIKLEKKGKVGQYTLKEYELVTRDWCNQVLSGDIDFLKDSAGGVQADLYIGMKTALLKPVVLVDYIREAYVYPTGNVRITFDMELKSGLSSTDLFNPEVPVVYALDPGTVIMEVKFDQFLPQSIQKLVSCVRNERDSISKYILCRDTMNRNNVG